MMPRRVLCVLFAAAAFATPATAAPDTAGAVRWVSDTPWLSGLIYSVYDPAYGRASPEVQRDRNANSRPLMIALRTWQHGFGCRGFSILEFDVPAGVTGVTGLAGIDDETVVAGGDTYFSIWADGKRLWQSPALSRDDAPVRFTVPLNGSRQVKLITDAQAYSNGDLADWCDVRWIDDTAPAKPEWSYAPEPGKWHVRAELHPFHLLYRGEDLTLSVATALAGDCRVTYDVSGDTGTPPSKGECTVHLAVVGEAATGSYVVPLAKARNGFYRAKFRVDTGDRTVAQREIRFGIMEPSPKRVQEGTIFGVNHHEFVSSFEPMAAAGIEWSRHWFCWQWIEPKKGEWRWNWHDERMAAAKESGLKTIGVLGGIGQPAWSSPDHVPEKSATTPGCPKDMADWEEYVRQVATRYRGKIQAWESWNEISYKADPGLDGWSVEKYVDLHRRTYRILKDIDPTNKVLVSADSLAFVDRCLKAGLDKDYDGVVVHPYRPGNNPEAHCGNALAGKPADIQVMFQDCRAWLSSRPRPDAEIWATEIGWALTGNDWPTVSEEEHGQYLARTYLLTHGAGCVANLCWHDFSLGMFGLCDGKGFPRPAMLSYAALTSRLTGAAPVRRCEVEAPVHGMLFHRGDVDVLALWSERPGEFVELRAPTERQLTLFDMFGNSGSWTLREQGRYLSLSGRVVYLEGPILSEVVLSRTADRDPIPHRSHGRAFLHRAVPDPKRVCGPRGTDSSSRSAARHCRGSGADRATPEVASGGGDATRLHRRPRSQRHAAPAYHRDAAGPANRDVHRLGTGALARSHAGAAICHPETGRQAG
ncbi:MAG: hypothetical protein A3K19_14185 [Lentisphaerae bacterium RIFOXYB12_FULL_65_16]|nr:MAG: hypothetical protein A3K18_16300 [Lentisphaerae bacterium RIFOXYA12_64_32]OGV89115.1 MAG: hypothetical protein A3K19_14185 [Lentisphaerae bacterium RIFOXYB12_FULL_65_16]